MDIEKYKNWTEYEWEQEFRVEDERINAYIEELSTCIDMPDEDKIIWDRLSKKNKQLSIPIWDDFEYDMLKIEDTELPTPEIDKHTELYFSIGRSASNFGVTLALSENGSVTEGLEILYLFGKLMSVYLDIIYLEGDEFPTLKAALFKRQIGIINRLIGRIKSFESKYTPDDIYKKNHYMDTLHKLREEIIDIRFSRNTNRQ